jgi:hypothetical protein
MFGIVGLIVGLIKTRQLIFLEPGKKLNTVEMDMDLTLLKLTSFFYFLYMIFTIITGIFKEHEAEFPDRLIVLYGCVGILQICLQIAFIQNLKQKVCKSFFSEYIIILLILNVYRYLGVKVMYSNI